MGKLYHANGFPLRGDMLELRKNAEQALDTFINKFMSKQDKIRTADDLIPGLLYSYGSGIDGGGQTQCILWKGLGERAAKIIGEKKDYDAQINIQVEPLDYNGATFVYIVQHKKNTEFLNLDNWKFKD
jgi:hypothetical protein